MPAHTLQFMEILRSSEKQAVLLCSDVLAPGLGRAYLRAIFAGWFMCSSASARCACWLESAQLVGSVQPQEAVELLCAH